MAALMSSGRCVLGDVAGNVNRPEPQSVPTLADKPRRADDTVVVKEINLSPVSMTGRKRSFNEVLDQGEVDDASQPAGGRAKAHQKHADLDDRCLPPHLTSKLQSSPSSASPASSAHSHSRSSSVNDNTDEAGLTPATIDDASQSGSVAVQPTAKEEQQAEALRLRLKVALFKIRTKQTDIPLSRLQIVLPGLSNNPPPSITASAESTDAQSLHRRSTTPLSDSPPTRLHSMDTPGVSRPTSPLILKEKVSAADRPGMLEFATPVLPRHRALQSPVKLGAVGTDDDMPDEHLTSSVVKGRAANGLLELMKGLSSEQQC